MNDYIKKYSEIFSKTLVSINGQEVPITEGGKMLCNCFLQARKSRAKVFFIGNGGSAAIAEHMSADYLKNARMRIVNMYNAATLTCLSNDYGYEDIFSRQIDFVAEPGDVLVAISSSGNSRNIIKAIETAKGIGCKVITLTGFAPDNLARKLGDVSVYVPSVEYGIVESIHNMVLQFVVDEVNKHNE